MPSRQTIGSDERGMAMIVALFMVLILSVLGSSLMFVSRTETLSSLNYKTMSQVRYGAEAGVHGAINHLLWTYTPPASTGTDPLANYDLTKYPVEYDGAPVVLSSDGGFAENYPISSVQDAFLAASQGSLGVNVGSVSYVSRATLLAMRTIPDPFIPGAEITLQRWHVTGTGRVPGAGAAEIEVSAIVERPAVPVFAYAAFATYSGCDALRFGGGADTGSYNSADYSGVGVPVTSPADGNVGTNGNLSEIGATTAINGTLSTPRTGVGSCSSGSVSALTTSGGATVTGGLVQLPQVVEFPDPPPPSPMPPTGNVSFNGGCPAATAAYCTITAAGPPATVTLDPALAGGTIVLGNVSVTGGTNLILKPGIYNVNSLGFAGNSTIGVDMSAGVPTDPVLFNVAGVGTMTPIDFVGGSISNASYDPTLMQILYAGDKDVKLTGGSSSAALVYAPNAGITFAGGSTFYGSVVGGIIKDMGGATINYDRRLDKTALMQGPPVLSAFTWKSF
jgi:hypothetical protein